MNLIGQIVEYSIFDKEDKFKRKFNCYILDILHPQQLQETNSRLFIIDEKQIIRRLVIDATNVKILTFEEQIEVFNKFFYKFTLVPEHLKDFMEKNFHK